MGRKQPGRRPPSSGVVIKRNFSGVKTGGNMMTRANNPKNVSFK